MKDLEEIDCNESIWSGVTCDLENGWNSLENECRFAFKTKNKEITEEDIDSVFWDKYLSADHIEVSKVKIKRKDFSDKEKLTNYFGVSMIIYESGI